MRTGTMSFKGSLLVALLLAALSLPARAEGVGEIHIGVRGMVCAFCAQGIKRAFGSEKGVRKVTVSLEAKQITLEVDPAAAPSDDRIRTLVNDAGFDVVKIDRSKP